MLLNWKVPSTNPKPNMMPAVELIVIHSKPIPMVFKMRSRYFLMPGSNVLVSDITNRHAFCSQPA